MNPLVLKGRKVIGYLSKIDPVLYLILFFCLAGLLRNILSIYVYGLNYSSVAVRAFIAMAVIYFSQILLIFLRQRSAWIISLIQCFFCFYVYEDFTAFPLVNILKLFLKNWLETADYGWIYFFNMTVISAMFSLELLKTYLIYTLTDEPAKNKNVKQPDNTLQGHKQI